MSNDTAWTPARIAAQSEVRAAMEEILARYPTVTRPERVSIAASLVLDEVRLGGIQCAVVDTICSELADSIESGGCTCQPRS